MGIKDGFKQQTAEMFLNKNKDRITQTQGKVLNVKIEKKNYLWIIHKMIVTILVKPENSKNTLICVYKKRRWFKKPDFISLSQGNTVLVQGLKSKTKKEKKDYIQILNMRNNTTKTFLHKVEGAENIKVQKARPTMKRK